MNFNRYETTKQAMRALGFVIDNLFDGLMARNGEGFSKPRTGKRRHQRLPAITPIERLLFMQDPKENPLPRQERSKRGKRKAAANARFIARSKDYQSRLNEWRKIPGVSNFAGKLPFPRWGQFNPAGEAYTS